ncbi:polysaccharide pyruvyl transferase family protein [Pseudoduganella lutea]|uniref:Polysaccharide pyruvyl transferase family protein n=1 Tax=Pseudoduganella lutea TaxID=321985 RepID=A0A4V0Z319_9BURK|nr:polysaccharide pyruvyl transferase family protein [Pseudoduganella lutea]QBE61903.1 polysaccharide pyruvyl transferase family protein [Pseudoduganella lutea]
MTQHQPSRRRALGVLSAAAGAAMLPFAALAAAGPRRIILRSHWQIENIGDVAHTPAALALLERHLPQVEVTLWPWYDEVPAHEIRMLTNRFPKLKIAQGKLDANGAGSTPELEAAVASADFMLHNSGPYALAWMDLEAFSKRTGKPFGVYGVTYGHWIFGNAEKDTLTRAAFAYFRDSVSLRKAELDGVKAPIMGWSPDVVFSTDVADDAAAARLLEKLGLADSRFMVCLPKQRYTPTWLHVRKKRAFDGRQHQRNEEMKDFDHAPLREAIVAVVRQTGLKILIGNEDETETEIGKTWVYDHLPEDVRRKVVWLDRPWTLEEAMGVYKRCEGMFSNEMHSPIMCIGLGVPAIVNRWVEQSSKGRMWDDIGLSEWLFNFDVEEEVAAFPAAVLKMAQQPAESRARAGRARDLTRRRHAETMAVLGKELDKARRA